MATMQAEILAAALRTAMTHGIHGWSLQRVATQAGCAKALVLHHFGSRSQLLEEVARTLADTRFERRVAALGLGGTSGLDRLWLTIGDDVKTGRSRAVFALASHGFPASRPDHASRVHAIAASALGIGPDELADPVALAAVLDGIELQLVMGTSVDVARAAFDRIWVAMISI